MTGGTSKLTKNQSLVLDTLGRAGKPMSAYAILDGLREQGFRAPPQVYRALDKLVDLGLVHRLESMNAFVACRQSDGHDHSTGKDLTAFAICEACGQVTEFSDPTVTTRLSGWARDSRFDTTKTTIEIRGICAGCQAA